MPTIPQKNKVLTNNSIAVINYIRKGANVDYQNAVPEVTKDAGSMRSVGAIIMNSPSLQNEFLHGLLNRVALVLVSSKSYTNPWSMFKRGVIDFGEVVEDVFVNLAKPFAFDDADSEGTIYKKEFPDVKVAFYVMNYQIFYKDTIEQDKLSKAFTSASGMSDLITKIIESMYTSMEYDEFIVMKYMLAKRILAGMMYPVSIPDSTLTENMKEIVATIKSVSNKITFMDSKYNLFKVKTHTQKADQYVILSSDFDASMDVNVLASAFNMDKAQFMGQRVLVDSFGALDNERLALIFKKDSTYVAITEDEVRALNSIPAIMVDKDFFMIFDNLQRVTEKYHEQDLYWNYWLHVWKTFAISPFANGVLFVPAVPNVISITVTPATASVTAGSMIQLTAVITTENFAPQTIVWTSSDVTKATVDSIGLVTVLEGATGTVVITASSQIEPETKGEVTLTIV